MYKLAVSLMSRSLQGSKASVSDDLIGESFHLSSPNDENPNFDHLPTKSKNV